jgi:hypothetical protein
MQAILLKTPVAVVAVVAVWEQVVGAYAKG